MFQVVGAAKPEVRLRPPRVRILQDGGFICGDNQFAIPVTEIGDVTQMRADGFDARHYWHG